MGGNAEERAVVRECPQRSDRAGPGIFLSSFQGLIPRQQRASLHLKVHSIRIFQVLGGLKLHVAPKMGQLHCTTGSQASVISRRVTGTGGDGRDRQECDGSTRVGCPRAWLGTGILVRELRSSVRAALVILGGKGLYMDDEIVWPFADAWLHVR